MDHEVGIGDYSLGVNFRDTQRNSRIKLKVLHGVADPTSLQEELGGRYESGGIDYRKCMV